MKYRKKSVEDTNKIIKTKLYFFDIIGGTWRKYPEAQMRDDLLLIFSTLFVYQETCYLLILAPPTCTVPISMD